MLPKKHFKTRPASMNFIGRGIATLCTAAACLLAACASGPTYNPSVFAYEMDTARLQASPVETVVITHVNLGSPSRNYLEEAEPRVDAALSAHFKANGFKVLPQRQFRQHWNAAVRAYGDPVDPTSGRVNMKTFSQIMQSVRDRFAEDGELDAFVFTDLVELDIPFNNGLKHIGRWDGVSRRPSLQGPGTGVSSDFDWSMTAAVASVQVTIFDTELQRLFVSRGGIDATEAIDARSSTGRYIRRRNILENDSFIREGVALAAHPFVPMKDYPGVP